jgi:hypothetical protein
MNKTKTSEAAAELGKRGGDATLKKYGKKHFKALAKKRVSKSGKRAK